LSKQEEIREQCFDRKGPGKVGGKADKLTQEECSSEQPLVELRVLNEESQLLREQTKLFRQGQQ